MQAPSDPISGYESRLEGNTFQTDYFKGRGGFMHPDKIDIIMAQSTGFNAGDFYAVWIAPMIAGRMPSLPSDPSINKCSLSVVGSILEWGNRYVWGPRFIDSTKNACKGNGKSLCFARAFIFQHSKGIAISIPTNRFTHLWRPWSSHVMVLSASQPRKELQSLHTSALFRVEGIRACLHLESMEGRSSDQHGDGSALSYYG